MSDLAVSCHFDSTGAVSVSHVTLDGLRQPVEQGRQWRDDVGLHVLVMLPGRPAQQLSLLRESLAWQLRPIPSARRPSQPV